MRTLVVLFIVSFVIAIVVSAYLLGQKSVTVSIAATSTQSVSCLKNDAQFAEAPKSTISFPLKKESKAVTKIVSFNDGLSDAKESIDTTVIHAIRQGKWSEEDNRVFLYYISSLDKKDRISVLKQMNKAINYQQMHIGSYIPNF